VIEPIRIAPMGRTKPAAGVIPTNPPKNPLAIPIAVGLPRKIHSISIHVKPPAEAAIVVLTKAVVARELEESALPPLKPNQPNQSKPIPRRTNGTLWGA